MARLTPEEILQNLEKEIYPEQPKGNLKIFLGYCAGVGKTYHMLDLAKELKKAGKDVVIGYIEPHERRETLALMEGFEMIPPKEMEYRKIKLKELDLEKVLQRKPELVLIDEMAHTNSEGMKHKKRYEDIYELLEAGIDVYTTLNIQHIQSISQKVKQITHVKINEIVPDEMIKRAQNIELIDIEPEELVTRLNQGKVYTREKVELAKNNFFTIENLMKLREIAMQYMVNSIDRKNISISLKQKILVCIKQKDFSKKEGEKIIELMNVLHGNWMILYFSPLYQTKKQKQEFYSYQKQIEGVGAKWKKAESRKMLKEIKKILEQREIAQLVVYRNLIEHSWFLPYRLLKTFAEIPLYFI